MPGPPPKPAHLRQRVNKKAGAAVLEMPPVAVVESEGKKLEEIPTTRPIPNPDGRVWHELTLSAWARAWASPMAAQWLDSDEDALGRLALLWDTFYKEPGDSKVMAEIRLQEQRFGLSPLDRSRLQWEFAKSNEAEERRNRGRQRHGKTGTDDPRRGLMAVK